MTHPVRVAINGQYVMSFTHQRLGHAAAETAQTDHHKPMLCASRIPRLPIQITLCAIFTNGRFYLLPELLPHSLQKISHFFYINTFSGG